jgi:hypothetical protein
MPGAGAAPGSAGVRAAACDPGGCALVRPLRRGGCPGRVGGRPRRGVPPHRTRRRTGAGTGSGGSGARAPRRPPRDRASGPGSYGSPGVGEAGGGDGPRTAPIARRVRAPPAGMQRPGERVPSPRMGCPVGRCQGTGGDRRSPGRGTADRGLIRSDPDGAARECHRAGAAGRSPGGGAADRGPSGSGLVGSRCGRESPRSPGRLPRGSSPLAAAHRLAGSGPKAGSGGAGTYWGLAGGTGPPRSIAPVSSRRADARGSLGASAGAREAGSERRPMPARFPGRAHRPIRRDGPRAPFAPAPRHRERAPSANGPSTRKRVPGPPYVFSPGSPLPPGPLLQERTEARAQEEPPDERAQRRQQVLFRRLGLQHLGGGALRP